MSSDRFRALIRILDPADRLLLECRIVDAWDYADIATRLGVPRADVVRRVHHLRTQLRRQAKTLGAT
jgi:DNA-directed RNA polymerase specialized sigma24 family protein